MAEKLKVSALEDGGVLFEWVSVLEAGPLYAVLDLIGVMKERESQVVGTSAFVVMPESDMEFLVLAEVLDALAETFPSSNRNSMRSLISGLGPGELLCWDGQFYIYRKKEG